VAFGEGVAKGTPERRRSLVGTWKGEQAEDLRPAAGGEFVVRELRARGHGRGPGRGI
jgi:hypothetical protein